MTPPAMPEQVRRIEGEGEAQIAIEAALVELVEQHGGDAIQFGIV